MKRPNHSTDSKWFWSKLKIQHDCWVWSNSKNNTGYGTLEWAGKPWVAHCLSYKLFFKYLPKKLELDHLCRNRACVNPFHLEPVTHRENILRGKSPSAVHAKKTHCSKGHPFYGANLKIRKHKDGRVKQRICRSCTGWSGING